MLVPGAGDAASLVEQMDRKDNLFSQIGDYISKVQAETGANAQNIRQKLLELDEAQKLIKENETKSIESKRREQRLGAEVAQTRSYNESLRADIEKLNAVVVAEKGLTKRQSQELAKWQDIVTALRAEVGQMRGEEKRADQLQAANVELNDEMNNVRNHVDDERLDLRKSVKTLSAQLEEVGREKADVSRHFWNLTEDTKTLKEEYEKTKAYSSELEAKYKELDGNHRSYTEMGGAQERSLVA
jgi:chromosome segregation ATPase